MPSLEEPLPVLDGRAAGASDDDRVVGRQVEQAKESRVISVPNRHENIIGTRASTRVESIRMPR